VPVKPAISSAKLPAAFASEAGIAIGPILFVLAILALLAAVMSAGFSDFGTAGTTDRIKADIQSQASLIRTKINECNIKYGTNNNGDGYPASDTASGTPVASLLCAGDPAGLQNIWSGIRAAQLPPPTAGFNPWQYINTNGSGMGGTAEGGRCIWIVPTAQTPKSNGGLVAGLTAAATHFSSGTAYSNAAEVIYDPASDSQKFILWITLPTGQPDPHCLP